MQETDWEYIDCVLIPDHASDRVGAVLFRTIRSKQAMLRSLMQTDTFNSMAHMQECLTNLDFQYLGGGAVTFRLKQKMV